MTSKATGNAKNHALPGRGSWFFRRRGRGFTLIELLVVIAIIGILSTIIMASLSSARKRGRDGRRISDIKQLQLALELYYDANNAYPTSLTSLPGPGYIPAVPKDPRSGYDYAYAALQGAGANAGDCKSYHLGAKLEINNAGQAGSPFGDDKDADAGGSYGASTDGTVCTGGAYSPSGGSDVPPNNGDFNGSNDAVNLVYDMRP